MAIPSLQQFLEVADKGKSFPRSSYVSEPGFRSLYVRNTYRCVRFEGDDDALIHCIDIANVTVWPSKRKKGIFTALVLRLLRDHNVCVECVTSPRFENHLIKLGFEKLPCQGGFPSYWHWKDCPTTITLPKKKKT